MSVAVCKISASKYRFKMASINKNYWNCWGQATIWKVNIIFAEEIEHDCYQREQEYNQKTLKDKEIKTMEKNKRIF